MQTVNFSPVIFYGKLRPSWSDSLWLFQRNSFSDYVGLLYSWIRAPIHKKWREEIFCERVKTCFATKLWLLIPGFLFFWCIVKIFLHWPNFGEASDAFPEWRVDLAPPCFWSAPLSISDRPRSDLELPFDSLTKLALSDNNVLADHSLLLLESSWCAEIVLLQVGGLD